MQGQNIDDINNKTKIVINNINRQKKLFILEMNNNIIH